MLRRALLLLCALVPAALCGGGVTSADARDFVLVVGHAYLGSQIDAEHAAMAVVVRDGKIAAIERDLSQVPRDLPQIHRPDAYLTPGLVAAASDVAGQHTGSESIAAGYRAIDAFDRYGDYRPWLAHGVTTIHLSPGSHRLLSGEGAVVKLAGAPNERVIVDRADLCLQLGDAADNPPALVEFPFPPSSDVAIQPAKRQRPLTRLGRLLGLDEELAAALADPNADRVHPRALAEAWQARQPVRIV